MKKDNISIKLLIEYYLIGYWTAESINVDGIITGGQDIREIFSIIEDAILTYYEVPRDLCRYFTVKFRMT